jgi:hypothetical protein
MNRGNEIRGNVTRGNEIRGNITRLCFRENGPQGIGPQGNEIWGIGTQG